MTEQDQVSDRILAGLRILYSYTGEVRIKEYNRNTGRVEYIDWHLQNYTQEQHDGELCKIRKNSE